MAQLVQMIYNLPLAVTVDVEEGEVYRVQELGDLIYHDPEKPMINGDDSDYDEQIEGELARKALAIAESNEWPVRD